MTSIPICQTVAEAYPMIEEDCWGPGRKQM